MKTRASLFVLLVAAISAAAITAPTPADSRAVRQKVDDLLRGRRQPEPLPMDPPNPFANASTATTTAAANREALSLPSASESSDAAAGAPRGEAALSKNAEQLTRYAARLRIAGLIRLKDQVHVIINDNAWKEGDFIIVERAPQMVQLQVVRIQAGAVALRLEEAELVLKF